MCPAPTPKLPNQNLKTNRKSDPSFSLSCVLFFKLPLHAGGAVDGGWWVPKAPSSYLNFILHNCSVNLLPCLISFSSQTPWDVIWVYRGQEGGPACDMALSRERKSQIWVFQGSRWSLLGGENSGLVSIAVSLAGVHCGNQGRWSYGPTDATIVENPNDGSSSVLAVCPSSFNFRITLTAVTPWEYYPAQSITFVSCTGHEVSWMSSLTHESCGGLGSANWHFILSRSTPLALSSFSTAPSIQLFFQHAWAAPLPMLFQHSWCLIPRCSSLSFKFLWAPFISPLCFDGNSPRSYPPPSQGGVHPHSFSAECLLGDTLYHRGNNF